MNMPTAQIFERLCTELSREEKVNLIPFETIIEIFAAKPKIFLRNVFQYFQDMVNHYVPAGINEYPDQESIGYLDYDTDKLFVEGLDVPFFADRLFKNRFMQIVSSLATNIGQNKVYILNGPHGCGKSTFINNILKKLELYSLSEEGIRYEIVWRLDSNQFGGYLGKKQAGQDKDDDDLQLMEEPEFLEIACPNHCNPLLIVPLSQRNEFLEALVRDEKLLNAVRTEKEYKWFFKDEACTTCQAIAKAVMERGISSKEMLKMLYARRYELSRRHGIGIIVYNPSDEGFGREVIKNRTKQSMLNRLLGSSHARLEHAKFADSNSGFFILMDVKDKNRKRLTDLHNVLSEGYCKVGRREENIDTFFIAVYNPEIDNDKKEEGILNDLSFLDRKCQISINYVLGYDVEVRILEHFFGSSIRNRFLPRVLENYAKIIISSRMDRKADSMASWIKVKDKYDKYCDRDLFLLKMEIYLGRIPEWLSEEDVASFTGKVRRSIIEESEKEGKGGFSGRESVGIFQNLLLAYPADELISMDKLLKYFTRQNGDLSKSLPNGFLDAIKRLYDYSVLQEVKEALFDYNVEQQKRDIKNYLFALNFNIGERVKCPYTGEEIIVSEDLFFALESVIYGRRTKQKDLQSHRDSTQKDIIQQMAMCHDIEETDKFKSMLRTYTRALSQKTFNPFVDNENFRKAINAFGKEEYLSYDERLRRDIDHMMEVLVNKFGYTKEGAKVVCVYVIENDLAIKLANL